MGARDILAHYRAAQLNAKAEQDARRARVLQHPDLAKRLTEPPLSFTLPEQWSGYVPPRTGPEDLCPECPYCHGRRHLAEANTSARRRVLVEICAEALRREQQLPEAPSEAAN